MGGQWRLVARNEIGDLLGRLGAKPLTRTLWVVTVFGLLVPWRFAGVANLPAFFALFMAFLPARLAAVDAFAGERERGTLEALLASPLPDRAIATGKIAAATAYGTARGWLFVAVWLPAAAVVELSGLATGMVPAAGVVLGALGGAVVVAYAAAVFGVWQSARAPSVRAVLESGGLLRLVLLVLVFFVGPWALGLLDPAAEGLALGQGQLLAAAVVVSVLAAVVLWRLTVAALARCQRESLLLVQTAAQSPATFGRTRRRGRTSPHA
jgi:ABC-2 type transport system permease protein